LKPKVNFAQNFIPKRSLSQNFLADETHLAPILKAARLQPTDVVLEIGPGLGILTEKLAQNVQNVTAVELDRRLIENLQERFQNHLESPHPPDLSVLMVQQEVAERICAKPGDLSILAISVQFYTQPQIIHYVPASAFRPQPKVNSAIITLERFPQPILPNVDTKIFFRIVRAGFSQKRKQLLNSLSGGLHLSKPIIRTTLMSLDIDPKRRAQSLSLDEWGKLSLELMSRIA